MITVMTNEDWSCPVFNLCSLVLVFILTCLYTLLFEFGEYFVIKLFFMLQNVALVELNGSDTEEEESVSDDSEAERKDSSECEEVTVDNIKFPKPKRKGRIEIVDSKTNS